MDAGDGDETLQMLPMIQKLTRAKDAAICTMQAGDFEDALWRIHDVEEISRKLAAGNRARDFAVKAVRDVIKTFFAVVPPFDLDYSSSLDMASVIGDAFASACGGYAAEYNIIDVLRDGINGGRKKDVFCMALSSKQLSNFTSGYRLIDEGSHACTKERLARLDAVIDIVSSGFSNLNSAWGEAVVFQIERQPCGTHDEFEVKYSFDPNHAGWFHLPLGGVCENLKTDVVQIARQKQEEGGDEYGVASAVLRRLLNERESLEAEVRYRAKYRANILLLKFTVKLIALASRARHRANSPGGAAADATLARIGEHPWVSPKRK
eukprot:92699-Prymnesium_polylepis.1